MRRRLSPQFCRALLLSLTLLCPALFVAAAQVVVVTQSGRAFSVSAVGIKRGDTIHFNNNDAFDHQIYVNSPIFKFESPEQAPGTSTDVTFSKSGAFEVQCEIHPRMHLSVTVE